MSIREDTQRRLSGLLFIRLDFWRVPNGSSSTWVGLLNEAAEIREYFNVDGYAQSLCFNPTSGKGTKIPDRNYYYWKQSAEVGSGILLYSPRVY